jgi:twitching motility two-component system response regulator PilH
MARVVLVGPGSEGITALETALRGRGHGVVVSEDVAHALLLLRVFKPEVVLVPRLPEAHELAVLRAESRAPLVVAGDVDVGRALQLVAQGVARVLPTSSGLPQIEAAIAAPLGKERGVERVLQQLALTDATGTVTVRPSDGGAVLGTILVEHGRAREARGVGAQDILRDLAMLDLAVVCEYLPGGTLAAASDADDDDLDDGVDIDIIDDIDGGALALSAASRAALLANLPPLSVLLVEDDRDLLRLYTLVLKKRGWRVEGFADAAAAFARAQIAPPDVIVTDLMMPRTSGWDLLGLVRSTARLRDTSFVLCSHNTELLQSLKRAGAGADAYVAKAARSEHVAMAIEKLLAPRRELELQLASGRARVEGRFVGCGAQWLLRDLARLQASGRLVLRNGALRVSIGLRAGHLVDANGIVGGEALARRESLRAVLLGRGGEVEFARSEAVGEGGTPLQAILDELCDDLDRRAEKLRTAASLGGVRLQARPALLDAYRTVCPPEALVVVDAVAAGRDVRPLVAQGASSALVERVVADLLRKDALVPDVGGRAPAA